MKREEPSGWSIFVVILPDSIKKRYSAFSPCLIAIYAKVASAVTPLPKTNYLKKELKTFTKRLSENAKTVRVKGSAI